MAMEKSARKKWLLAWLLAWATALAGCSTPGVATPLPEPPSLDPTRISVPEITPVTAPSPVDIAGKAGAAPAHAIVRVTNLDSTDAPVTTTADDQGAFQLVAVVDNGNELRLQAIASNGRSAPVDFIYAQGRLTPSPRSTCITVSPGFELDFTAVSSGRLSLGNACGAPATLADPRQRLGVADFRLTTVLPLDVAAGASAPLDVTFARTVAGEREDVLFVSVEVAGQTLRYPFTVFAPASAP